MQSSSMASICCILCLQWVWLWDRLITLDNMAKLLLKFFKQSMTSADICKNYLLNLQSWWNACFLYQHIILDWAQVIICHYIAAVCFKFIGRLSYIHSWKAAKAVCWIGLCVWFISIVVLNVYILEHTNYIIYSQYSCICSLHTLYLFWLHSHEIIYQTLFLYTASREKLGGGQEWG